MRRGDIDTGDGPTTVRDLAALDAAMVGRWMDLRECGAPCLYARGPGDVVRCATVADLAAVTRADRRRVGARWPEDG